MHSIYVSCSLLIAVAYITALDASSLSSTSCSLQWNNTVPNLANFVLPGLVVGDNIALLEYYDKDNLKKGTAFELQSGNIAYALSPSLCGNGIPLYDISTNSFILSNKSATIALDPQAGKPKWFAAVDGPCARIISGDLVIETDKCGSTQTDALGIDIKTGDIIYSHPFYSLNSFFFVAANERVAVAALFQTVNYVFLDSKSGTFYDRSNPCSSVRMGAQIALRDDILYSCYPKDNNSSQILGYDTNNKCAVVVNITTPDYGGQCVYPPPFGYASGDIILNDKATVAYLLLANPPGLMAVDLLHGKTKWRVSLPSTHDGEKVVAMYSCLTENTLWFYQGYQYNKNGGTATALTKALAVDAESGAQLCAHDLDDNQLDTAPRCGAGLTVALMEDKQPYLFALGI